MNEVCTLVDVSKRYGRHAALHRVTLTLTAGEILGLVGPNGAGKTSLLRIAAGLLRPTAGHVWRVQAAPHVVRYFAGERTLPPDVSAKRWSRLWTGERRDDVDRRRIAALSRGMRQRLGLETTIPSSSSHSTASLVLLDEPWEGLDPDAARWLSAQLVQSRNAGAAVMVSSHRIHDLAEVCDRCVFLNGGAIAEDVRMSSSLAVGVDRSVMLFEAFDRLRGVQQ